MRTALILTILLPSVLFGQVQLFQIDSVYSVAQNFFQTPGQTEYRTVEFNFLGNNYEFDLKFKSYDSGLLNTTSGAGIIVQGNNDIETSRTSVWETNIPGAIFDQNSCAQQTPPCFGYTALTWTNHMLVGFDSLQIIKDTLSFSAPTPEYLIPWGGWNSSVLFEIVYMLECNSDYPCGISEQTKEYFGITIKNDGNDHFGWVKFKRLNDKILIENIGINTVPYEGVVAGQSDFFEYPENLEQAYDQNGITLNWNPYPNSVGCQVRGGPTGGTDTHNFIVQGTEPTQLFINGNGLTVGQDYQWKVRCATGLNPYSGITPWSAYDYFIYNP